jgi:hypothetical protein
MRPDTPESDRDNTTGPDLTALERRLAAWRPAAGALDRDRMLYDAGRAAAGARPWRPATAALLLATTGLGGLLVRERIQLAREGSLLAHERAHRLEAETALAARTRTSRTSPAIPSSVPSIAAVEPPAPDSYLVLTSRLAQGVAEAPRPDDGRPPAPTGPPPGSSEPSTRPVPLRPINIRRVLEL